MLAAHRKQAQVWHTERSSLTHETMAPQKADGTDVFLPSTDAGWRVLIAIFCS